MDTLRSILRDIALVTYTVAGAFLCVLLWNARTIPAGVNTALATVNAGCIDNGHQVVCGTLASVAQTTKNVGILAAQSAEQVKQSGKLITAAADTITTVGKHVNGTMDALTGTAQTASSSLQSATDHLTPVLDAAKLTTLDSDAAIKGLLPLEDAATVSVNHFDDLVTSKDVTRFLNSTAETSEQVAGIATDLHKATTDATKPLPWWRKALGYGNLGVNIACLATHSCPF